MAAEAYDFAFSLGFSCGCTQSLRAVGMQCASYPFDWTGSPGLLASVGMIETDFANWLDAEDLELYDVRRAPLFSQVYRNSRTRFGFPHDFSSFRCFDTEYPMVKSQYARRINRLYETIRSSQRVLAIYIERMIDPRISDDALVEARRRLMAKFPKVQVDLLYFYQVDGETNAREAAVAEGIVSVGVDYAKIEGGVVIHEVNRSPIEAYLREKIRVTDNQSEREKANREAFLRSKRGKRWGKAGWCRRHFNEIAYKVFRRMERRLISEGLIPREEPLWF